MEKSFSMRELTEAGYKIKICFVCGKLLETGKGYRNLCDNEFCRTEAKRVYARRYYNTHPEQLQKRKEFYAKMKTTEKASKLAETLKELLQDEDAKAILKQAFTGAV